MEIDTTLDFWRDPNGRDPDRYDPTLRGYHQFLWSKPLPDGRPFVLTDVWPRGYLHHRSEAGEFWLASDSVMQTFTRWTAVEPLVQSFAPTYIKEFRAITSTIGGMMIFPGNTVDGKMTINGARGFHRRIADRMDLTLECVRRHYCGETSPLEGTLKRYRDFFALFGDFRGYVEFFLLQDLVTSDDLTVRFFAPFSNFTTPAVPRDVTTYAEFMRTSIAFVEARNLRIAAWAVRATAA